MNFATIVVLIVIGAALCAAVFSMIRSHRKDGCRECSGRCSGCSGCSDCFGASNASLRSRHLERPVPGESEKKA